ncbi:MAG: hypothetical protein DI534_15205 [Leifsonia xyli]|jgi:hypothetical protein|nr:MAG: hypothetical protein DI534_15205 [Leifsonia xyli]
MIRESIMFHHASIVSGPDQGPQGEHVLPGLGSMAPSVGRAMEIEVEGLRLRLPAPGEEPLVVGSVTIRPIDLGDGRFMHEIRAVR